MNYRKKNTQALEDYRPDFLLKYKKAIESNHQSNIKVTSFPAKIESEYLVVETAGQTYRLVSSYSPEQEAKRWASQFVYQNLDIVVSIFGFGCGSLIRELLYGKENNMKVLVYEPSLEIFSYVFEHYDLTDLFRNSSLSICVKGVNEWDFEDIIGRSIHWTNVKSQIICTHPQYEKLFLEENRDFLTVVHENNTRTLVNRNTEAFFGRDIVENTLMNLKFVRSSITICDLMNQIPKDIPAIIVSAGPSLEKNIEELKRAKGKSFLVATDSAMKLLFSHDIVPDVFVTLDALKPESYLSDERFMQVPCICKIESNWRILYHHGVRKV